MKEVWIKSSPIYDVVMSHVSEYYALSIQRYLEGLGCRVTYQGQRGKYQIQFPAGTTENTYAGQSTQWTHRTVVFFPGGARITRFILTPLNPLYPAYNTLAFPNDVLFGPEPVQQTPSLRPE